MTTAVVVTAAATRTPIPAAEPVTMATAPSTRAIIYASSFVRAANSRSRSVIPPAEWVVQRTTTRL